MYLLAKLISLIKINFCMTIYEVILFCRGDISAFQNCMYTRGCYIKGGWYFRICGLKKIIILSLSSSVIGGRPVKTAGDVLLLEFPYFSLLVVAAQGELHWMPTLLLIECGTYRQNLSCTWLQLFHVRLISSFSTKWQQSIYINGRTLFFSVLERMQAVLVPTPTSMAFKYDCVTLPDAKTLVYCPSVAIS